MKRILLFIFLFYANFANAVVYSQSDVDKLVYQVLFWLFLVFIAFLFILKLIFSNIKSKLKDKEKKNN